MQLAQRWQQFYTQFAPLEAIDPEAPRHWKEKVLFYFMAFAAPGVFVLLICGLPFIIKNQYWLLLGTAICAFCSAVSFTFFSRHLNFILRSATVSCLIYLFGLAVIFAVGPFLASREWLFLFSIVASILLGWPGVVLSILMNALALIGIGILIIQGFWSSLPISGNPLDLWIQVAVDILFINLAATLFVTYLFYRIEGSHRIARSSADLLRAERTKLLEANQTLEVEIATRKRLEQKLSQAQKMQAIGTLAGGVAHDFNNLLAAITGYTELAAMTSEKGTELDHCLTQVRKACRRAEELVKQILAFARQADQNREPLQISHIAEEVLTLMRSTIPSSIRIDSAFDSQSKVLADPTQIHQIFLNLGSNAAQAMENDGGVLQVRVVDTVVSVHQASEYIDLSPGDYVQITVSDTGIGISEANLDTVFEPYFTTKPTGTGTGLGLSVVHGIVKGLHGEINVASQFGQGTCITIYLPVTHEAGPKNTNSDSILPRGTEHILIVDDEQAVAEMTGQTLQHFGYRVTICTSSQEALTLFGRQPASIDAIVTDMTMPEMTGDLLAAKAKAIRPDIPVLLCTGYSKKLGNREAAEIGVEALCMKPLATSALVSTLRDILDQARR